MSPKPSGPKAPRKDWQVYLLLCEGGSLYTGISPDPAKRLEQHRSGKGAAYTRMHKPLELLATETIGSYSQALRREAQLKRLSPKGKRAWAQDPAGLARPAEDADWIRHRAPKRKRRTKRSAKKKSPA